MPLFTIVKTAFPNAYLRMKTLGGKLFLDEVDRLTLQHCGSRVIDGPFKGMRYVDHANCSALSPKLLGTYERELHAFIAEAIETGYSNVIDIGAAEGYYAAGLALRMGGCVVHAFDTDPEARSNLATLSALNGVQGTVVIHNECTFETLESFQGHRCLVICDIEGAELELLNPQAAPALVGFDILVEIHDGPSSTTIHDTLESRFASTHDLTFIKFIERQPSDAANAPWLRHARNRLLAVDEQRTFGIEWGIFRSKKRA